MIYCFYLVCVAAGGGRQKRFDFLPESNRLIVIPSAARLPKAAEPGRPKAARTTALGNWDDGNEQKFLKTTTDGRRTTTTKSDTILRCDSPNFFIFLQFEFFFVYVFLRFFSNFFFNEFDCKNLKMFSHFCRLKTIMKWSKCFLYS